MCKKNKRKSSIGGSTLLFRYTSRISSKSDTEPLCNSAPLPLSLSPGYVYMLSCLCLCLSFIISCLFISLASSLSQYLDFASLASLLPSGLFVAQPVSFAALLIPLHLLPLTRLPLCLSTCLLLFFFISLPRALALPFFYCTCCYFC